MVANQKNNLPLAIVDFLIVNLVLLGSFYFRYPERNFFEDISYINLLLFFNLNWLICSAVFRAYRDYRIRSFDKIIRTGLQTVLLHLLLVAVLWVVVKGYYFSRQILITSYIALLVSTVLWRIIYFGQLLSKRKSGKNLKNIIILGKTPTTEELASFFTGNKQHGYQFLGFFDNDITEGVLGKNDEVYSYAKQNEVEEIYCLVPKIENEEVKKLQLFAENNTIRLNLVPDIQSLTNSNSRIDFFGNTPIVQLQEFPLDKPINKFWKRSFDVVFSLLIICLIFSWLFPLIAILILLESRGPIFFIQDRSGLNNKHFKCFKFRSMKHNKEVEFKQATKNDSRITKFGAFMRKTSIDELPQFLNVFLGQMSVVGPRPHPLKLDEEFKNIISSYMARHYVKPGITGLAQVKGFRGETDTSAKMKARVSLDNFYIRSWSFLFDVKIIFRTILNVFIKEENAY